MLQARTHAHTQYMHEKHTHICTTDMHASMHAHLHACMHTNHMHASMHMCIVCAHAREHIQKQTKCIQLNAKCISEYLKEVTVLLIMQKYTVLFIVYASLQATHFIFLM